ncbi:hypothetical protein JTE90_023959 [Oedothorax gibbosus]|uniref:Integrase catalytic domain-containing protein n=1 Tax=Oedothorax gibbosus TaxID=931172 RepID=A0AAV6USA3_9ARAC|nr:hypothetical protein JTE90_023959 [Oedothorax gibbosus]
MLMSGLREQFWVLKARKTIRDCLRKCTICQRFNNKHSEAQPGILPADRVSDTAIFEIVGVDLAGPLYIKGGQKAYIVLYTCAVYRAIHLELVTLLSTEAFLQSLRRFIARRGRPKIIYSDNGTNFVGANRVLKAVDWKRVSFQAVDHKIQWKFNPPSAACWGGWWERLIQMVKRILRKILGRAALTYEELLTVSCDCEQVVNTRPLTYVSEDVDVVAPLTPSMFLHEVKTSGVPDIDEVDNSELNKRSKHLQEIREVLRSRFRSEYLGQLCQQSFKDKLKNPIAVGDIVLLEDPNKKRTFWSMARVLKLITGKDGHKRLALIKTETTELLRPVQRLYRLELDIPINDKAEELINSEIVKTRSGRISKPPNRL